ncbi:hypothetical protein L596_009727 [Steinernema carpocapsae]|uniref:Uncharacterized protein n=2 Tax=Steinernema carpocapsae TaxID=34508 RepID=A0A4U5PH07_STECR|nr:hypothetical protein L596_009727 [Steinernema carpocapsae]
MSLILGLITGKEASSSARQPLSDMRTPKSSPSHTVMSFRSQDVVTTKESTSPVHQPLSDMRTPKASSPAHTATNLRSQGLDTGKEATSPARQPLSDMRTGPEASFMATGLEATSPARQPLSYMRTPKGSPTHSLHSQGLVTGKEACSPARQPLSDMRTPPRKPTEATSPTVKSSRSDLLQTGIEASSPARTARGFRSQEVIVLAGNEPTTGVFTAVSPLHAARSCEALATAKELVEIAKGEDNETTAVEMTSPVHTALSIISEATATDRDFTVSSGYDAFSDHDEPTLDVDTAREINSGIDRQAILRTMGYTVPSQLDTNVLQPRENASSTEVAAAGLAKTPDDFDAKISAYSLVAPDQFEDLKPRDNASSTEVAAAGLAKTPEAFDAKVSSYVQSLGKQPSEFSLESACPSQESSQFDI